MIDAYQAIVMPFISLVGNGALWPVPVSLALLALLALAIPRLRGKLGERRVARLLSRLWAGEVLHDVILPDSRGGLTQIDHLVLSPSGLLVVETKNYRGQIFGLAHDAQWTQRLGRHRQAFQNPLRQNHAHLEAVRALVPGIRLIGRVVFAGTATFPQGVPAGVSTLRSLAEDLRVELGPEGWQGPPSTRVEAAWAKLRTLADQRPEARKAHLQGLADRYGTDRVKWRPYVALIVSGLWLGWMALNENTPASSKPVSSVASARTLHAPTPHPQTRPAPSSPQPLHGSRQAALPRSTASPECNAAIAGVLADNSPENRRRRDQICGR